jgi:hypothetical protein
MPVVQEQEQEQEHQKGELRVRHGLVAAVAAVAVVLLFYEE